MSTQAQYVGTPKSAVATISAANTNFDGTGSMATVYTAGANGARIERVVIEATGTTAAGLVNLFLGTDAAANTASNVHLYDSVAVSAVTASATVAPWTGSRADATAPDKWPLILAAGQTLRASTTIAQGFRVVAVGGDY